MDNRCRKTEIFFNRAAHFIATNGNKIASSQVKGNTAYQIGQQIRDLKYALNSLESKFNTWTLEEEAAVIDFYTVHLKLMDYSSEPVDCFEEFDDDSADSCDRTLTLCDFNALVPTTYVDLKDTDNSLVGKAFQVPVVTEDEKNLLFSDAFTITRHLTWSSLLSLQRAGEVKPWDKYIIIDQLDRPIYIFGQSPDGKSWYNEIDNDGVETLRHIDDGSIPPTLPIMREVTWINNIASLDFINGESAEVELEYKDNVTVENVLNASTPFLKVLERDYESHTIQGRVRGINPTTLWSVWLGFVLRPLATDPAENLIVDLNAGRKVITFSWDPVVNAVGYTMHFGVGDSSNPLEVYTTETSVATSYNIFESENKTITWKVKTNYSGDICSRTVVGPNILLPSVVEPRVNRLIYQVDKINITLGFGTDYSHFELIYSIDGIETLIPSPRSTTLIPFDKDENEHTVTAKVRGTAPILGEFSATSTMVIGEKDGAMVDSITYANNEDVTVYFDKGDFTSINLMMYVDNLIFDTANGLTGTTYITQVVRDKMDIPIYVIIQGATPELDDWGDQFFYTILGYEQPSRLEVQGFEDKVKMSFPAVPNAVSYTFRYGWDVVDEEDMLSTTNTYSYLTIDQAEAGKVLTWKVKANYQHGDSYHSYGPSFIAIFLPTPVLSMYNFMETNLTATYKFSWNNTAGVYTVNTVLDEVSNSFPDTKSSFVITVGKTEENQTLDVTVIGTDPETLVSNTIQNIVSPIPRFDTPIITSIVYDVATANGSITTVWGVSPNATSYIVALYKLWNSGTLGLVEEVTSTELTHTFTNVIASGDAFVVKVVAVGPIKENSLEAVSEEVGAERLDTPVVVAELIVNGDWTGVGLSWDAITNASWYWIQWVKDGELDALENTSETSVTKQYVKSSDAEIEVYAEVYATNEGDIDSHRGVSSTIIIPQELILTKPTNVELTLINEEEAHYTFIGTWDVVPNADTYKVEFLAAGVVQETVTTSALTAQADISRDYSGEYGGVRVRALDNLPYTQGPYKDSVGIILPERLLGDPTNLMPFEMVELLLLQCEWDSAVGAVEYEVAKVDSNDYWTPIRVTETICEIGIEPGPAYDVGFKVRARYDGNNLGNWVYSDKVRATGTRNKPAPSGPSISLTGRTVTGSCAAVEGAVTYGFNLIGTGISMSSKTPTVTIEAPAGSGDVYFIISASTTLGSTDVATTDSVYISS